MGTSLPQFGEGGFLKSKFDFRKTDEALPNIANHPAGQRQQIPGIFAMPKTVSLLQCSPLSEMAKFLPKIQFLQEEISSGRRNV